MAEKLDSRLSLSQPGIILPPLACGTSMSFRLQPETDPRATLRALRDGFDLTWGIVGVGEQTARQASATIEGLRTFPALSGPMTSIPSTQQALWVFLRGENRSALFDLEEQVKDLVKPAYAFEDVLGTFTYRDGRDLSGYLDGTANPEGDEAIEAGFAGGMLAGSSFVAVQRWVHDLARFGTFTPQRRDDIMGRRLSDNEEFEEAPESSHVKRTAQETYDPPAFMVRRSMPWANGTEQGLEFIAYGSDLDKFERMLKKMAGLDDGISDALFTFSRPTRGGYYWCPPVREGKLDLRLLGI